MSLINDALKQASRSPKTAAVAAGGLHPVEDPRAGRGASIVLPILLVVVLAGAGWFLWQWWQAKNNGSAFNVATLVQSVKSLIPGNKSASDSTPAGNGDASAAPGIASTNGASANATTGKADASKSESGFLARVFTKQPAPAAGGTPGVFPTVKVQGIYYRAGDSAVLINGKNLSEGDEIEGVTIAKIDRATVTLEFQGQTKEIKLR